MSFAIVENDKELHARCVACKQEFLLMYLPQPIGIVVSLARDARCPKCGADGNEISVFGRPQ